MKSCLWDYLWRLYEGDHPAARTVLHAYVFHEDYPGIYRVGLRRWRLGVNI